MTNASRQRCPRLGIRKVRRLLVTSFKAGIDTTIIALWLGHERVDTTAIYLHAHLDIKEKALAATTPPTVSPGRYRPPDHLLAFLEGL